MNRKTLGALIALNVVLLAGLAAVCLSPKPAQAQGFAGSSYLMLAGDVVGRDQQAAIYIIDVNTGQIAAVFFNGSTGKFEEVAYKNVADDLVGK